MPRAKTHHKTTFSEFLTDPTIAGAFLVIGLIALMLSISEFANSLFYYY